MLVEEERTIIIYESPHRILRLLDEIILHFGPKRIITAARELTKKFEEIIRAPAPEVRKTLSERPSIKGEFVIIIAGAGYTE